MTSMLIRSFKSIFSSGSDEDHEAMDKVRELAERFAIEYLQRLKCLKCLDLMPFNSTNKLFNLIVNELDT